MSNEAKTKKSFGTLAVKRISPTPENLPAINIYVSFEEALKLYFGLSQALAKLNSYNRATTEGKRAVVSLCLYTDIMRMTINEGKLPKDKKT